MLSWNNMTFLWNIVRKLNFYQKICKDTVDEVFVLNENGTSMSKKK